MKRKKIFAFLFLLACCWQAQAQWAPNVNVVIAERGVRTNVDGDLNTGQKVDLAWGYKSANACYPEAARVYFRGNHVLYTVYLQPHQSAEIILKPTNDSTKVSMYAYLVGANNFTSVVPNVNGCISCKSDYGLATPPKKPADPKTDKPKANETPIAPPPPTNVRKLFIKGIGNQAYHLMFGVAGAEPTSTEGSYTIEVLVK
ncbi:MAG: hypothetical protein ACOVQA_03580 [Thermoflexibacteraceae bacterium]|jgi:hypothetical protein